ncbi:unnamed protein product [Phaedon cochleariae]|uniref:C2H2-type domain-containing protein n=1 Tax=Phaedon cochleariae TaxID=80249 RepID=A0A9N9SJU9_PHACE|nr:unnamed protein product [Phaedon cochleariae]
MLLFKRKKKESEPRKIEEQITNTKTIYDNIEINMQLSRLEKAKVLTTALRHYVRNKHIKAHADGLLAETPEDNVIQFLYPVLGLLDCSACRREQRISTFAAPEAAQVHVEANHPKLTIQWKCRDCTRIFPGWKNIIQHPRYCKREAPIEIGEFQCEQCPRKFSTKTGRSLHQKSAHPVERNIARLESAQKPVAKPPRRVQGGWTEDEEARLVELEPQYRGEYYINKLLQPHFPGRTVKQISDKRRNIAERNMRRDREANNENAEQAPHPLGLPEAPLPNIETT